MFAGHWAAVSIGIDLISQVDRWADLALPTMMAILCLCVSFVLFACVRVLITWLFLLFHPPEICFLSTSPWSERACTRCISAHCSRSAACVQTQIISIFQTKTSTPTQVQNNRFAHNSRQKRNRPLDDLSHTLLVMVRIGELSFLFPQVIPSPMCQEIDMMMCSTRKSVFEGGGMTQNDKSVDSVWSTNRKMQLSGYSNVQTNQNAQKYLEKKQSKHKNWENIWENDRDGKRKARRFDLMIALFSFPRLRFFFIYLHPSDLLKL